MYLFFSLFSLIFKWSRFIFVLISLEFMVMSLFFYYCGFVSEMMFFFFMCFSVVSSVLGMLMMVINMKFYGSDLSLF